MKKIFKPKYVYSPAGPEKLWSTSLKECIEFIGSKQPGKASNWAKGKKYLRDKIPNCTGKAIKRASRTAIKIKNHNYTTYGFHVYYYHVTCAEILYEVIDFLLKSDIQERKNYINDISSRDECMDFLYDHRLIQLKWIVNNDFNKQYDLANEILKKFSVNKRS